jgi:hypothetical protein
MPALSAYANTENTALIILQRKGYQLWYDESIQRFCCEKDGWDFTAESATELLGVVAIYDYHHPDQCQEYWWKINEPWLIDGLPRQPKDYDPIWNTAADKNGPNRVGGGI